MKNIETTHSLTLLKDQIAAMESQMRHLDSVVSGHMRTLDALYGKGAGVKPVRMAASHLAPGKTLLEQLASSAFKSAAGGMGRAAGSQWLGNGGPSSGGGGTNASSGQMLGQLASAISRAMSRNL